MILDAANLFDTAVAITSTANSTNTIDLGQPRDLGVGDDPAQKLMVEVVTAFATGNGATLTVGFQGSTDNTTWTTYFSSPAYAAATLVQGARLLDLDLPRPPAGVATPRYLRLAYTVGTGAFTAGNLTAGIVLGRQDYVNYPPGIGIAN